MTMARVPLYKTAETEMIRRIRSGEWAEGLRLPNEFELAEAFGVSQGTMRRALITLEGMGLLHRKPGRGTEVRAAAPAPASVLDARSAEAPPGPVLRDRSGAPLAFEVYRARSLTRGADAGELSLFGSYRLATLERTLRHAGKRAALEDVALPEALLPALSEDADTEFGELLRDAGLPVALIEDRLGAAITSMSESVALSCDRHTALIILTRIARDADGTAIARQRLRVIAEGVSYST